MVKYFKNSPPSAPFVYVVLYKQFYRIKTADFRRLWSRIVGVESKHCDRLTTTNILAHQYSSKLISIFCDIRMTQLEEEVSEYQTSNESLNLEMVCKLRRLWRCCCWRSCCCCWRSGCCCSWWWCCLLLLAFIPLLLLTFWLLLLVF